MGPVKKGRTETEEMGFSANGPIIFLKRSYPFFVDEEIQT
jgi:hypothetical protein